MAAARSRALGKLQVAMLVSLVLIYRGSSCDRKISEVCKVVLEIGYPAALGTVWNFSSEKTDRERKNAVSGISVILE